MNISLDLKQKQILNRAREFAEREIRPFVNEIEKAEALPRDLIDKLAAEGYLGSTFPEEYGGLALDPITYGLLTEEIGKADANTRGLLTVHVSLVGESILKWGKKEQKAYWIPKMIQGEQLGAFALTEPDVGTDAKNVQTHYQRQGSDFLLNGQKKWISFGEIADFFLVIASQAKEVTAFIVERERAGVTTRPLTGLLAGRASHIAEVQLDNVVIPKENILGQEGAGFSYIVSTALDHGRYSIAWSGVALAQAALEAMVSYARERSQFGKKLRSFQLIQGMIADAVTKTHAARALCLRAGRLRTAGDLDAIVETSLAKYYASKAAMAVTHDAVQIHGGNGCYDKYPVERYFREAKILEIVEGTSQIQQEILAAYGIKKYYTRRSV